MSEENIKIVIVFIGKPQWEAGWPYLGFDNNTTIDSIKKHLNEKFSEFKFKYCELVTTYNSELVKQIKEDINDADGVIIFTIGHYGDPGIVQTGIEIIESGKPVILANLIYAGDHTFTKIFSTIKDKNYQIAFLSSQNIEHFDKMFENMFNILKLRGKKILVYAKDTIKMNWPVILGLFNPERKQIAKNHPEFLNQIGKMSSDEEFEFYTDTVGFDQAHKWRKDETQYKKILKDVFDVEMIRGDPDEILKYFNEVNSDQAEKIAQKWVKDANIVEPNEKTILNSAKLYLAFKNILIDKEIDIFAPDCGTFLLCGALPAYPCMPFFELSNEGIFGICESDMDSAISFLFGLCLTGRPGYVSNHTFDRERNQITYLHCVAPCNLEGLESPKAPYDIVYHGETHFLGASPRVKFPIGKPVTTIKISVFDKKISIRTGKIIDNIVDDRGCVSKMLVESNVEKIMKNYDWATFGWHRVTFIGDWKEDFINGAKILGLEIVDEDT